MTGDHSTDQTGSTTAAGVADRLGDVSATDEAWREALAHLDDAPNDDLDWPEPYTTWDRADLDDLVAVLAFVSADAPGSEHTADHELLGAVLTYMADHLSAGNSLGLYDGHRLLAAARAYQCRFADLVEVAEHWLEDAWPGLTSALGSFIDQAGIGRQLVADDPWVYVPDAVGGFYCFSSANDTLRALAGPAAPTGRGRPPQTSPALATSGTNVEDQSGVDPAEWYGLPDAENMLGELRGEVETICEYSQEARDDLDNGEPADVDLDNVSIAVSSVHAAAERGLEYLARLRAPQRNQESI